MLDIPGMPMPHTTDDGTEVVVTETEREIWKERIKIYVKDERQLQDQLKNMYSIIWGQVSGELRATVKSTSGLSAAVDKFYAIDLLKIIQKAMLNYKGQQHFTESVHMIKRSFYFKGQEKGSTVQEYYENFKNNMEVMEQLRIPLGADHGMVDHILTEGG